MRILLTAFLTAAAPAGAAAQSITWMGPYPPGGSGSVRAISADGSAAAGSASVPSSFHAFRWHAPGPTESLPVPPGTARWEAYSISPAGDATVGDVILSSSHACRWDAAGILLDLGTLPGPGSGFSDARMISADGVIVGTSSSSAGTRAYRWTPATGMTPLPPPPALLFSSALCISGDGLTVGGTSGSPYRATIWVGGQPQDLGLLPGDVYADVRYLSPDGSIAIGVSGLDNNVSSATRKAFRWTAATGMRRLFDIPAGSDVSAASADGNIVVGGYIWTAAGGVRTAPEVLADYGITMEGYAGAISPDGRIIGGSGTDNGQPQGWVATLPPGLGCYANCDHSTAAPLLNVLDFNCFLNRFTAGDAYANCDHSTSPPVLNVLDFNCFLNAFTAGCP